MQLINFICSDIGWKEVRISGDSERGGTNLESGVVGLFKGYANVPVVAITISGWVS